MIKRIYHPYTLWEDYKNGFFKSETDLNLEEQILACKDLFLDLKEFENVLSVLIKDWKYSMEHNLTNEALNKIAYLGQASCSYKFKISNDISRQGYNLLTEEEKQKADDMAKKYLEKWESEIYVNQNI